MQEAPQILIMTQPVPLPLAEQYVDESGMTVFAGAIKKSELLIVLCKRSAKLSIIHNFHS
jgi:hypothetical protein